MKKTFCSVVAMGLLGASAMAQEVAPKVEGAAETALQTVVPAAVLPAGPCKITAFNKASAFLGTAVKNAEGKEIGKVQDLVFDPAKGTVGYAVVALEAREGKTRSVAVPLTALKANESEHYLSLNMSEPILAAAEGLSEESWPAVDTFAVGGPAEAETGGGSSSTETSTPTPVQEEERTEESAK